MEKEFAKYFSEEILEEEEFLKELNPEIIRLCNYLSVDPIPIVFEEINDEARYYVKDNYIGLSKELMKNKENALECLIHEFRHYYQNICVRHNDITEPLLDLWRKDLELDYNNMEPMEAICLSIELDAYAFTKYIMKLWYNIDVVIASEEYEAALVKYIDKFFI